MVYLNLDKHDDLNIFDKVYSAKEIIQIIELKKRSSIVPKKSLLFIDEIQHSVFAMNQLRFLFEELPDLHVIVAGSLLEIKIKKEGFSFPVGRVEYTYMHPLSFDEFLKANDELKSLEIINNINLKSKIPTPIHEELKNKFYLYANVGGMPEVVATFLKNRNILETEPIQESLFTSFKDDVFKYSSQARAQYLQYVIEHAPAFVGTRIKYQNFAGSNYGSREISDAFDTLEKAMIINRIYSSSSKQAPIMKNIRKSPKLLFLDVGLVNYKLGLSDQLINIRELNDIYRGQIIEQIVGQTLQCWHWQKLSNCAYWYREKKGSISELDFIVQLNSQLIPIEVKSGSEGKLKSLHQFMQEAHLPVAIRVYSGELCSQIITTTDKHKYTLFSIPIYLLHRLPDILSANNF